MLVCKILKHVFVVMIRNMTDMGKQATATCLAQETVVKHAAEPLQCKSTVLVRYINVHC